MWQHRRSGYPPKLNMPPRSLFAAWIVLLAVSTAHATDMPNTQQVQEWWKAKSPEEMTIEGPLQEVHLRNKEVAFMAPVGFYQRGRNFIWHAVLVRPELQEVRELPEPVGHDFSVEDVEGNGVSEVLSVAVASGQGTTESVHSIVQLDGFNPMVMHQAVSRDNLGECHHACKKISIDWKFEPPSGTARPLLVETVTTSTGPAPERLRSRKDVKRYVLDGDTFVRAGSAAGRNAE
jgi:hypothetical protein